MHDYAHAETVTNPLANPGSAGWAAGGAFAGRVIGGLPGLIVAAVTAKPAAEGEAPEPSYAGAAVRWLGQIGGAAGGAALGAPDGLKGRAAVGAAIGGAIPFLGAPLAAVGAYIATRPQARQNPYEQNPVGTGTVVALSLLGLAVLGTGTYYGVKELKKRRELKAAEDGGELPPGEANVDEWGTNMDKNEHWGAGPVVGQDGKDYAYVIYHNLEDDSYWVAFRGESQTGSTGPYATSDEAEWCVENRLPHPCIGYPGES